MIITIDGPTASGKSSVSRVVASKLGCYYLYTGLLYRALAYMLIKQYGATLATIAQPDMKEIDAILADNKVVYTYTHDTYEQIVYDGQNITPFLKDGAIDHAASLLSTNPSVREKLNELQRLIAYEHDVVIDGRDSGSVVFPQAEYKFFLTASPQERAQRWYRQQKARGKEISMLEARESIAKRDARDAGRLHAPLIVPEGAITIDNSGMTVEQTAQEIIKYVA